MLSIFGTVSSPPWWFWNWHLDIFSYDNLQKYDSLLYKLEKSMLSCALCSLGRLKLEWPSIYSPQSWTLPYKSLNYTSLQINSKCADSCASQYKHLIKHSLQSVFNINLILFCADGLDQWIYKDDICHISILILKVQNTNLTTTHCLEIDNILAFIFNLESLD